MSDKFLLSPKYLDFFKNNATVEFLEGTTFAGKTTVAVPKFMFMVAKSPKKLHIISGLDLGTIEKNIIQKDLGILDMFGATVKYNGNGSKDYKLPHLVYDTGVDEKIIFVLGYDNKARWKKALGGQYGCLYIDEFNIADIDYVREVSMRNDYMLCTLNPDDDTLPCYKEYVDSSRPLKKYDKSVPTEIWKQLRKQQPKKGWTYWFFTFEDNLGLDQAKKEQIIRNVPVGSKLYKNKIQGLRGRVTGLVFANFSDKNIITKKQAKKYKYRYYVVSVDTSYSSQSDDTIALLFQGVTMCRKFITLDEMVYNNADLDNPTAPSDTISNVLEFAERNRKEWGFAKNVYIDSADQATITEGKKYKRLNGSLYQFENAWKKMQIIDRIHLQQGWIQQGDYLVIDGCVEHIRELETYSWKEEKYEPQDSNDHTINANQYGFLPFVRWIGDAK
jgi:phage terminase, large subunit, PBSX family